MAETVKEHSTAGRGANQMGGTGRDPSLGAGGKSTRDDLADAASGASTMLKEQGAKIAENAQELASDVKDRFQQRIEEQKDAGADYVVRVADAMRRAAHEFEQDIPIAAKFIGVAASTVDDYAERFREGNLSDLLEGTKAFAKRQPTAFLGLTFLAGFGLVRFLKSSSTSSEERATRYDPQDEQWDGEQWSGTRGDTYSSRR